MDNVSNGILEFDEVFTLIYMCSHKILHNAIISYMDKRKWIVRHVQKYTHMPSQYLLIYRPAFALIMSDCVLEFGKVLTLIEMCSH